MRGGKLLTQSKPEDLIRAYNAVVSFIVQEKFRNLIESKK